MSTVIETPHAVNELNIELLGIQALNPFVRGDAPARQGMSSSHLTQSLVIEGATVRRQQTGAEREYAKYTHKIFFPCDAVIVKVLRRYPESVHMQGAQSPTISIIYTNSETGELSMLEVPTYHSLHQYFGFKYVFTDVLNRLAPGDTVPKGTLIAHSPNLRPGGSYAYGIEAQVAFMSIAAVIEDGVVITDEFARKCRTTAFTKRIIKCGRKSFPLNMNGTLDNYLPLPDIGSRVRPDGLLFATRTMNELLSPFDLLPVNTLTVGHYDQRVYGIPGAKVIDIKVLRQSTDRSYLPTGMADQFERYYQRTLEYNNELLRAQKEVQRRSGSRRIQPKMFNALTRAEAMVRNQPNSRSRTELTYNGATIDEWEIEVTLEYVLTPTIGYKFTDGHGCKGVLCDIIPAAHAPVDATGNRADMIADAESPVNRSVMGRLFEHYQNASLRITAENVRKMVADKVPSTTIMDYINNLYRIVSPTMIPYTTAADFDYEHHIQCICREGIFIDAPPDAPLDFIRMTRLLEQHYPAPLGPVTYTDKYGNSVKTKRSVLIGGIYIIMLEKIGNLWSAVSSAKRQHFGVPAKISKADKYSAPGRNSAIRTLGEAEVRNTSAYVDGDLVADIFDQTNSSRSHEYVCDMLLTAPSPSRIEVLIDRTVAPRGKGRPINLANGSLRCAGLSLKKL